MKQYVQNYKTVVLPKPYKPEGYDLRRWVGDQRERLKKKTCLSTTIPRITQEWDVLLFPLWCLKNIMSQCDECVTAKNKLVNQTIV